MFHQVPEGKVGKNRVHPDLGNSDYDLEGSEFDLVALAP